MENEYTIFCADFIISVILESALFFTIFTKK